MGNPNITLAIDKGPMKGETVDCSPGNVIRIGRFVRGNTLAIKDPGISHKHITVAFHQNISRWSITDLGSSNGTIVNCTLIPPDTAFPLSNGDNIKIGEKTLISVKISAPTLVPEPRTRRERKKAVAAATSQIKIVESKNQGGKDRHQGKICFNSTNIDNDIKRVPGEGKRRRTRSGSVDACSSKGQMENEDVDAKENSISKNQNHKKNLAKRKKAIASTRVSMNNLDLVTIESSIANLKEKGLAMTARHEVDGATYNGGKGRSRSKSCVDTGVLRKGSLSDHVATENEIVLTMKEECMEILKNMDGLCKDVVKGQEVNKRGDGPVNATCKDELLEPVVVHPMRRVTRASTMTMNIAALVRKEHKGEYENTKKERVEATKERVKCMERGRRSNRSTRILRKGETLELAKIEESIVESLSRPLVGKELVASREVSFNVEEETHRYTMNSGEFNKIDDLHFSNKKIYSWNSLSEKRGIPNTTSKFREDRMINYHATPFEAMVERALNRGIAETSSSMEV